jgi:hypothetical protein
MAILVNSGSPLWAHFPVLILDKNEVSKGSKTQISVRWGHPFESEWENCPEPLSLIAQTPEGQTIPLKFIKTEKLLGGKAFTLFQAEYTPDTRGDHKIVATWAPKTEKGEEIPTREIASTWLHVQQEKGWDKPSDSAGWTALTRPYGFYPGMVVQSKMPKPTDFEFEMLNETPPPGLPKPTLITFTGKTDERGIATIALPKAGWWALAGNQISKNNDGKILRTHHVLWLKVDALDK